MPNSVRAAWQRWTIVAETIAHFQAGVIFALLYFTLVAPFAIGLKLLSDPLRIRHSPTGTYWIELKRQTASLDEARRQS